MSEPDNVRVVEGVMSPMTAKNMRVGGGTSRTSGTGEAVRVLRVELPADALGLVPPKLVNEDPVICDPATHQHALEAARWLVNNLDKVPHTPGWDGVLAMAYTTIEKIGGGIK